MVEKLAEYFWYNEYGVQKTNFANIRILYKTNGTSVDLVVIFDFDTPPTIEEDQYLRILNQIENGYHRKGYLVVKILSLICTKEVESVKPYCKSTSYVNWVIDTEFSNLIVFENQPNAFGDVRLQIEQLLTNQSQRMVQSKEEPNPTIHTFSNQQMSDFDEPVYTTNIPTKKEWKETNQKGSTIQDSSFSSVSGKRTVTLIVVLINVFVFALMALKEGSYSIGVGFRTDSLVNWGATSYFDIVDHLQVYRLFTAMFLHANFNHILSNMMIFIVVGYELEPAIGSIKFLIIYLVAGLIANIGSVFITMGPASYVVGVGASGAISGVMGALIFLMIRYRKNLLGFRSKRFFLFIVATAYSSFQPQTGIDNVCHIVGFIAGVVLFIILDLVRRKQRTG